MSLNLMKSKKMKNTLLEQSNLFLLFVWVGCKTLELSLLNESIPFNVGITSITYVIIIFFSIQMLTFEYYIKTLLIFLFLLIGSFCVYLYSGNNTLFFLVIVIFRIGLSPYSEIEKYIKSIYFSLILSFISILFMMLIGVIPDLIQFRENELRHSLGFRLAIYPPGVLYSITIISIYLKRYNLTVRRIITLSILNFIIMELSSGRTYFIQIVLISFLLIPILAIRKENKLKMYSKFILLFSYLSLFIGMSVSFMVAQMYDGSNILLNKLNIILNNRVLFWSKYFDMYDIRFFGQKILIESSEQTIKTGLGGITLDNMYIYVLLHMGLFSFTLSIILLSILLFKLYRINDVVSSILWLSIILTFMSGNNGILLNRNFLLLQFTILVIPSSLFRKNILKQHYHLLIEKNSET